MSNFGQEGPARIDDPVLIRSFLDAHDALVGATRNEYATNPAAFADMDPNDSAILIGATNESHCIDFSIATPEIVARGGLWQWIKSRLAGRRPEPVITMTVQELTPISHSTDALITAPAPVELVFSCVPDGRYMLDSQINAALPSQSSRPTSGSLAGEHDALVADLANCFKDPEYLPNSREGHFALQAALAAVTKVAKDPGTHLEFGIPVTNLIRGKLAADLTQDVMRLHPALPSLHSGDIMTGRVFGERTMATVPDDKGRQSTLNFSRLGIGLTLDLGITTGAFPSTIHLEFAPATHQDQERPVVRMMDGQGVPLFLSRSDRKMIANFAQETLRTHEFINQPTARDALKPTESVLAACAQLTKEEAFEFPFLHSELGDGVTARLSRNPNTNGYSLVIIGRDVARVHNFDSEGVGMTSMSAAEVLGLYDLLEKFTKG